MGDKTLKAVVGRKKFNYVLASHVIEHVPDMISWLKDIADVLRPEGILSLVIPDKRYTFDIIRSETRTSDIVGAYIDNLGRSSTAMIYDFAREYRKNVNPSEVVSNLLTDASKLKRRYTLMETMKMVETNASRKEYVDCHCHVFTPYSFFEVIKELIRLNLLDYEVVSYHHTLSNGIEFYVSFKKSNKSKPQKLQTIPRINSPVTTQELNLQAQHLEFDNLILREEIKKLLAPSHGVSPSP